MLKLYDASLRQAEVIRPAHPRELRVLAVAPSPAEPQPRQWRDWLQPDLIRRCAERRSLVPTICEITSPLAGPAAGTGPVPDHAAARGALNIHPPARIAAAGEPVEQTVEFVEPRRADSRADGAPPFDIGTGAPDWLAGAQLAGAQLAGGQLVGHVLAPTGVVAAGDGPQHLADVTGRGLDPLALRLVFLSQRYRDDTDLSWDALHTADKTLRRWRESVAEWALSPSLAMARGYAEAVIAAFEDDLDTPAALRQLDALAADGDLPEGAKFETFAALDRLFGLDLARDIGKISAPRDR